MNYEEERTAVAKEFNIRVSVLDKQVAARRKDDDDIATNEKTLGIEDVAPWPDPVELDEVLDDTALSLAQYVVADPVLIHTAALWSAHTHILDYIGVSPRLAAQAPGPGCGKTITMEAIGNLVPRALTASSITPAVIFRVIDEAQPTLLLDEADQMLSDRSSPLVAVLNSSHRKSSAFVMRIVEVLPGQFEPTRFSTWAPVMFAGIRELPPTLQDRSIILRLRRAKPGEVKNHLRDGKCPALIECGQKLARWADDLVALPDVELPAILTNRIGDNWRPLLAIAELAGGDWPARALEAAQAAVKRQDQGLLSVLLADIAEIFGERERILSQELVDGLVALDEKPYGELNRGHAITTNWLARQLKDVVSTPTKTMRISAERKKGYSRDAFTDAWERYGIGDNDEGVSATQPETTELSVTTGQSLPDKGYNGTDAKQMPPSVTDRGPDVSETSQLPDDENPNAIASCHVITDDTGEFACFADEPDGETEPLADGEGDTCLL
jgi:putative DNA primase/helicase